MYKKAMLEARYQELLWNLKHLRNLEIQEFERSFIIKKKADPDRTVTCTLTDETMFIMLEDWGITVEDKEYKTVKPAYNYITKVLK